ncbi:MAG: UDP-N-acetylglucosamine 2-epimerase [Candidatus Latescibacterota bacterium]|nr:UDP-N-acetylglucosamine 2-epimerase [Candidatus Latescibacterota bacterium]
MRTIGVVTVARSDYGIYLPVLKRIVADSELKLHLIVAGMHLTEEFGHTVDLIEADGFAVGDRVDMLHTSNTPEGISKSGGLGMIGFAESFVKNRPDILLVLGDRFEMHAAAIAALPFKIPVAHVHGGEVTSGAIDDALRHSMTKLSHLHFVTTDAYRSRVEQLGEDPCRVVVSGAPSLDNLQDIELLSSAEFEGVSRVPAGEPFLLVTFHPVTLEYEHTEAHFGELLAVLAQRQEPVLFTMANADTYGRTVNRMIQEFVSANASRAYSVDNLGTQRYFSAMSLAAVMLGNSSSGIIEAATFGLPVVNIGRRQEGRVRGLNVIDSPPDRTSILAALDRALSSAFCEGFKRLTNPYGQGNASERIVDGLKSAVLDDTLLIKRFRDLPGLPS